MIITSNGYHVPTDNIFYVRVDENSCMIGLVPEKNLHFDLPREEVQPILERAGFVSFGNLFINPSKVLFLQEGQTSVAIHGSGNYLYLQGQENIDRALEMLNPKSGAPAKKAK
jgi:hypothetical protein